MAVDILLVPIHLDALYLKTDRSVVGAMADFSRMPYYDGARDVNPDVANISEEILSQPYDARSLQLKAGIHLHWALPDALTRGFQRKQATSIDFPPLPNRWLVTRTDSVSCKQWIVESDYLYPPNNENQQSGISYPYRSGIQSQPFRYMGRKLPLAAWNLAAKDGGGSAEYLDNLTAIGYGEPTFAAFYPNCLSVFGFHDETPPSELAGVQYDIIGWYSQAEKDCLQFRALKEAFAKKQSEALKEVYKWVVQNVQDTPVLAQQTICYAHLSFGAANFTNDLPEQRNVAVAVGNTSTEALSAYLSDYCRRNNNLAKKIPNPEHLEDQLEAVQLAGRLEGRQVDIGPKFLEARHNKEFTGIQAGTLWAIRPETGAPTLVNAPAAIQSKVEIPASLANQLHCLNVMQQAYDRDCEDIESMRKQLFADWYKYMLCAYPPESNRDRYPSMDEVKYFIEKRSLIPLQRRIDSNKSLNIELAQAVKNLDDEVKRLEFIALKPTPAPRYWQPNEPVVLLVDIDEAGKSKTVIPTPRHGQDGRLRDDGLLECHTIKLSGTAIEQHLEEIRAQISKLRPDKDKKRIGFSEWLQQPWHPFMLEWEVEVMPIRGKYQEDEDLDPQLRHPLTRNYASDCITANYQLDEYAVDFVIRPGQETLIKESNRYYGRSILTPHAKLQMLNQIKSFLEKQLLDDYYVSADVKPDNRTNDYFTKNIDTIIKWAHKKNDEILNQILSVYEYLNANDDGDSALHLLAQSLSGFNQALLMHKQTLQLTIDDPLGFADYQPFTIAVQVAVGGSNRVAPQPRNDFNPIRTGILKINHLRLVDTFGQIQKLNVQDNQIITTDAMTTPANPHLTILPPRIVQPARINFRWLAANEEFTLEEDDDPEMNSHTASTPICGWLLPNNLDNSLMVYDTQGRALGSLNQYGQWQAAPGDHRLIAAWPLPNPHLHQVVVYLKEQGSKFLDEFMTVVENALDNIDPENAAQHESLALLMGRPIAVVRARLNLELQGLPAIDQDWNVFQQDMEYAFIHGIQERETGDFTQVEFPIRIGEYKQLNDGLVGYWIEEGDHYKDNTFYAPQAEPGEGITHSDIMVHRDKQPIQLLQSISSSPHTLTLLIDPRGCVHATSGILPTKAIQIPPEQFADALRNIEVTFLSAPILTERGKINLPLPDEPGYVWSWLEKENGAWDNVTQIGQVTFQAILTTNSELREGWLKLTKTDQKEK